MSFRIKEILNKQRSKKLHEFVNRQAFKIDFKQAI
jgi:hypothetical protein